VTDPAALFVAEARKLIGAKWRHRGRSRFAVDCIGLIAVAGQAAQLLAEDEARYGREPWEDRLRQGCRARWGDPVADRRPGDIAIIRWRQGEPSHMGIIGDKPGGLTLIHAHNLHGVVECSLAGKIEACVVEVYRPRFA
jgi:cell wall-associated NlpC family hydrolase